MAIIRPVAILVANIIVAVLLPFLYLLELFWRVRIVPVLVDRIGNFSEDTQLYLARRRLDGGLPPRTSHILVGGNPINQQLLTMFQRVLPIHGSRASAAFLHYTKKLLGKTRFTHHLFQTHDDHFEFQYQVPILSFNSEEMSKGRELLKKMGIGDDDWYVCFHARDASYAESRAPELQPDQIDTKATHRNANIHSFLEAAKYVVEQGGYAIRMGAVVAEPLPSDLSPRIIDYATKYRSDFGDIFFTGTCRFFLGSPSGLSSAAMLFDVPIATAHRIPLFPPPHGPRSLFIPRFVRRRGDNDVMRFDDVDAMGMFEFEHDRWWVRNDQFDEANVEIEPSSPSDIVDLCKDMLDRLEGVEPSEAGAKYQQIFIDKFGSKGKSFPFAPRIGPRFAEKYRSMIV